MSIIVTNVDMKLKYDRLRIDKALGNLRRSDNKNNNSQNNVRSAWDPFRVKQ